MINGILYIFMGLMLGIIIQRFIFSIRTPRQFLINIRPVFDASRSYITALLPVMVDENEMKKHQSDFAKQREALERSLLNQHGRYPESVFTIGFNPGLRAGFRSFLINVDRMTGLLFSITSVSDAERDSQFSQSIQFLSQAITTAMKNNQTIIQSLADLSNRKKSDIQEVDYINDIVTLEAKLKELIPDNIELIDLSPNYVRLAILVRDIRDLRQVLLQLLSSLTSARDSRL